MKKIYFLLCLSIALGLGTSEAISAEKCVNAEAEAAIVNNDIPSARLEAIARAKWSAIEQVVGTEIKAQSFVQNFTLVEDVIKTKAGGVVKSYKVVKQENRQEIVNVMINACVEPAGAKEAVSQLALNNSVAIFIPARKPGRSGDEFEETNILSETLIGKITEQNYTVVDVAPTGTVDAREIENSMKSGSTLAVRSMMYKFLSNLIIIGKVDYTISTKKGENIGYGIAMPFNNVTVRLTYRMIAKNNKTGNMEILTAGTEQAKGLANNVEDAAAEAMKELSQNLAPVILDKIATYIKGNTKKVAVRINGVTDVDTVLEMKGLLQSIVWVSEVEEKQMGDFIVSYPENTLYLANSIKQKVGFKIINFSPYSLTLDYQQGRE
ncbi:MAG: hypothetical protein CVU54_01065 [Deltaproteobacteria bacterium HGW-Deltaproteobacteria-12]|jgi:hypothetical protein|nr:MAG: hypothetical protein CVU54_01065 [Deltaproteobacteria bacterium HGW-Deltaproteobacteria-12]